MLKTSLILLEKPKEQVIQENLKILQRNVQKKRNAQAKYYGQQEQNNPTFKNQFFKKPVHERLGGQKMPLRRFYNFTNSNGIALNKRIRRPNAFGQRLLPKFPRNNTMSAQVRLDRIRERHLLENLAVNKRNNIKLKRYMTQAKPINYMVQVPNDSMFKNENFEPHLKHNIQRELNPTLQEEIKLIQTQNIHSPEVIPSLPIHALGFGMTKVSLNVRFSMS